MLWPSWIPEMYIAKFDGSFHVFDPLASIGPRVDGGLTVEERFQLVCGMLGFAHVWGEREYCTGALCAKDDRGEYEEELEHRVLTATDKSAAIPKAESDAQKHERLGRRVEK